MLSVDDFKREFNDPTARMDLIKFIKEELNLKTPKLTANTIKQHNTLIKKLETFYKRGLSFNQVGTDFLKRFNNKLIEQKNGSATIEKLRKILKHYLEAERKKSISVPDTEIKIKTFKSNRNALNEHEVAKLHKYYISKKCPDNHRRVL